MLSIPVRGDRVLVSLCRALLQYTFAAALICNGCASGGTTHAEAVDQEPPPDWLGRDSGNDGKVCAVGIAGRTHKMASEKAKDLSRERAVRNLAGVFETLVEESQIDDANQDGTDIEYARYVDVSEDMLERVGGAAETEYWRDEGGSGPFEESGFTYARACVSADLLRDAKIDSEKILKMANDTQLTAEEAPPWLTWIGSQKGARLCAVGFSLPALHPDATFENVVEDVRGQLTEQSRTLIMSLSEEFSVCREGGERCDTAIRIMTAATSEAISKGVLVNHFWYDRKGIGPNHRKRSTYGWGCTHPVGPLKNAVARVKEELPEVDLPPEERVKMHAAAFFEELEKEEEKR